jgi:hypothetical protein
MAATNMTAITKIISAKQKMIQANKCTIPYIYRTYSEKEAKDFLLKS